MEKVFLLKGLDCPHCAAKIERSVSKLKGVHYCCLNFVQQTMTVRLDGAKVEPIGQQIVQTVHHYEPDVQVSELTENRGKEEKNQDVPENRNMIIRLIVGAALFAAGLFLEKWVIFPVRLVLLVLAYLILGGDVVLRAGKNIIKGSVFDENFLMTLSTVGAFLIGEYPEAVAVMLFYQVGEFFQELSVQRSRASIADLMDIRPDSTTVMREGEWISVSPEAVVVGEIILIKAGEKVPLDGIVTEGNSALDTKALTGESLPKSVAPGAEILSGSINGAGMLTVRVTKRYGESTVAKIIDLVENASSRKAPTENFITTFAKYYTPAVVILAAVLAVGMPLLLGGGWTQWLHRGLIFLVVSCPCALVISVPLTFFGGIGAASKHGVLIKGSNYLEALNNVDTVVFDKTGTLTQGSFRVTKILPAEGFTADEVLAFAAQVESRSNHPIAKSILSAFGREPDSVLLANYREISGYGICASMDGKQVLAGSSRLLTLEGIDLPDLTEIGTKVFVAMGGVYAGCIVIADEIKKDSKSAIEKLRRLGVEKIAMLTGDEQEIANAVAGELGLDACFAQLLPDQKVEKLEQLQNLKSAGRKLAFVGDGINDAPVLARADVGIAMGGLGSDAAIEAADVVLMTDEPSKLVEAMEIAGTTKRIVIQNIVFALGVKATVLILGALGIAGMWEAVFADVGVAMLAVLNAMRILKK